MWSYVYFNDTATAEIYTLSLHDALPICDQVIAVADRHRGFVLRSALTSGEQGGGTFELRIPVDEVRQSLRELSALADVRSRKDRKSTRLNSSHANISYAVFCLKQ